MKIDYLAPFISAFDIVCFFIIFISASSIWQGYKHHLVLGQLSKSLLDKTFFYIFIGFLIFNLSFSHSPLVTLFKIARIVLYFLAGHYVMKLTLSKENISPHSHVANDIGIIRSDSGPKYFFYGLFASTLIILILAFWQFVTKSSVGGLWYFLGERSITLSLPGIAKITFEGREFLRPYSTFSHPNSMGGFYIVLYFLVDWILNKKQPLYLDLGQGSEDDLKRQYWVTKERMLLLGTQILSLFLIIFSFSKVTIATFIFISFIKIFLDKVYTGCIICFVARISFFLFLLSFGFLFSGDPYTFDKRFFLASQSLEIIKNNLLFGVGLGASLVAQSKLTGPIPGRFADTLQPVHNIYLLFASEAGFIGITLLSYLIYVYRKVFIKWQKLPVTAISAILISGFFDHYWLTLPQNIALLCLVFSIIILSSSKAQNQENHTCSNASHLVRR